jgi:hypothetical protein
MKMIDKPTELALKHRSAQCLMVGRVECVGVICPNITPVDEFVYCGRDFFKAIQYELVEVCSKGFYLACDSFGEVVGEICPFDPPRLADKYRLEVQIEELRVIVDELTTKLK